MSRKLLFVSGMLTAFSCQQVSGESGVDPARDQLIEHLATFSYMSPLDITASALVRAGQQEPAGRLFDFYDEFLGHLDRRETREYLKLLAPADAYKDRVFMELRDLSHGFQDVLSEVFFERDSEIRDLNKKYGVF